MNIPLAERIRPKTLQGYLSQQHLVGETGALTKQLQSGMIPSMLFWGPPGIGKTTLATIIASESERPFYQLSAIDSGVAAVREIIEKAKKAKECPHCGKTQFELVFTKPTIFVEKTEIGEHRLLPIRLRVLQAKRF